MALALVGILDLLVLMITSCLEEKGVPNRMKRLQKEFFAGETLFAFVLRIAVLVYGQWFTSSLVAQPSLIYEYEHLMDIFREPPDYGGHGSGGSGGSASGSGGSGGSSGSGRR